MPSSKGSPGPHDRRDPTQPRPQCINKTRKGKRCKRFATNHFLRGQTERSKLCKFHEQKAAGLITVVQHNPNFKPGPGAKDAMQTGGPTPAQSVRSGLDTQAKRAAKRLMDVPNETWAQAEFGVSFQALTPSHLILTKQATEALRKLGLEPTPGFDPKIALLSTVESAWRQSRVWEAMLASIPEEDWDHIGITPIPGLPETSRGARIEIIQRHLSEATKNAARTSKLAIDAGIEERLVRLAEEQSALIADTVRAGVIAAIGSLHLSPKAEAAAIEAALSSAASHLRALASGGPDIIEGVAKEVLPMSKASQQAAARSHRKDLEELERQRQESVGG